MGMWDWVCDCLMWMSVIYTILGLVCCGQLLINRLGGGGCHHLKLMPHFLLIWGVCMDAIDSNSGISFSERLRAVVTALKEQKSVSNRNAANVSECK